MKISIISFCLFLTLGAAAIAQTPPPDAPIVPPPAAGTQNSPGVAAQDVEFQVSGVEVQAMRQGKLAAALALPAAPARWKISGNFLLAACRMEGLVVVDISDPLNMKIVSVLEKGKEIVDFHEENGLLALVTATYDVEPYRVDLQGGKPIAVRELVSEEWRSKLFAHRETGKPVGKVTHVSRGYATFILFDGVSLGVGDFVEIRSGRKGTVYDPVQIREEERVTLELRCVSRVVQAQKGVAAVLLGRGDDPKAGDIVYLSDRPVTGSNFLPQRYRDQWRASAEIIPLVGSGDNDDRSFLSVVLRGSLHYHADAPFSVQVGVDPLTVLGTSKYDDTVGFNVFGVISYETRSFEIGAGFGYQRPLLKGENPHNRHGGVFLQRVRLGALDGLNLVFQFQSVYSDDNKEKKTRAMVGMIHAECNVPLMREVTLFGRYFGDGRTLNHVGIGLRTYLRGTGGPGSFLVPVSLGYTSFSPYRPSQEAGADTDETYEVSGTTLSAGIEYRF